MKKLSWMIAAALLMVGCGSNDEIKLSDQTGFHQAVEYGGELGTAIYNSKSYAEFKSASKQAQRYAAAFKDQLGGESYLAYLKSLTSAMNGYVMSESDIDMDSDILNIRTFFKTNNTDNTSTTKSAASELGLEYAKRLKAISSKEEYVTLRNEIVAKAEEYLKNGDKNGYTEFVGNTFADEFNSMGN